MCSVSVFFAPQSFKMISNSPCSSNCRKLSSPENMGTRRGKKRKENYILCFRREKERKLDVMLCDSPSPVLEKRDVTLGEKG